jgi:predicted nucleic acid-binding protein
MLANVAVALEYEATCRGAEHVLAAGLAIGEVELFLNVVVAMAEPVESHFMWRPQLRDPADELVLEAATNGRAEAIVTYNRRDFGKVPSRFGLDVLTPVEAIRRIG